MQYISFSAYAICIASLKFQCCLHISQAFVASDKEFHLGGRTLSPNTEIAELDKFHSDFSFL